MNERYLYRGKRLDDGEWVYGVAFPHDNTKVTMFRQHQLDGTLEGIEVYPDTVGQYTGLKDKNNVKIFMGDICRDSLGMTFVAGWDSGNARFIGYTTDTWDINTGKYVQGEKRICYAAREPKVEVIGNIHDKEVTK